MFAQVAQMAKFRKNFVPAALAMIGFLTGAPYLSALVLFKCVLFGIAMFLAFSTARIFEDRSTQGQICEQGMAPCPVKTALALGLPSLILTVLLFRHALLPWIIVLILSAAYCADSIGLKRVPVLSTVTVFCIVLFSFAAGYGAAKEVNPIAFLIGVYFALIFASGHLISEAAELNFDAALQNRSNARTFGVEAVVRFSFAAFCFAFVYLLFLSLSGIVGFKYTLAFLIALPIQAVFYLRTKRDDQDILVYRFAYRLLYGAAFAIFVMVRLASTS